MEKKEFIKEFKVRIDQVKCGKYKTFQPELPTKKFLFSDEKESIHNMKLLCDDSSDQNKATATVYSKKEDDKETVLKPKELKQEEIKEKKPEKVRTEVRKAITGMFRDGIRRIDLVLVVKDDFVGPLNNLKMNFLVYIVKVGLEVEIEPGVMTKHKNLTFIKIHAPGPVLEKFGKFFGTKRYFADTRYDYMKRKSQNYEKEWLMLVRNNYEPNGYSNYERGIIVYKILLHLSFGDNANYYGIERLLNKKIIIDVFALHDGPYFITPDQTVSGSNARQILNYYWSGIQNIFQQQPIHLIHEYFGPRLAFYFAFYEFFNKALKVAAFLGIFMIIFGALNLNNLEYEIKKTICENRWPICRYCESETICYERKVLEFCLSISIHLVLDHMLVPVYSIATVGGTFIFLRLWQRKEYFLKWMWEVGRQDSYYKNAVRPLFNIGFGIRTDPFIGGLQYNERIIPIFIRNVISKAILIMYWYYTVPLMYKNYYSYLAFAEILDDYGKASPKYRDYNVMAMFQMVNIFLVTVFEKIYHYIVYFLVKCENHSSYKKLHNSIVIKKIGFKMLFQYAFLAYFSLLHGAHPRYLRVHRDYWSPYATFRYLMNRVYGINDHDIWRMSRNYCFPYTCIIEVSFLLATLLIVTQVVYKLFNYIFCLITDYNQRWCCNWDVPCWELEYRLSSVTEENILQKYINLAAQLCLITWFGVLFPLTPMILYLINTWDIRHEARKLLLASRRPLLIKTPGTGMTKVFYFIATFAILTNAINLVTLTRTKIRYLLYKTGKNDTQLLDTIYWWFETVRCYVPGMFKWNGNIKFWDQGLTYWRLFYHKDYYLLFLNGYCIFTAFVFVFVFLVPIIVYTISRQREVEIARATEEKIRGLYYQYEYEYDKDLKDK